MPQASTTKKPTNLTLNTDLLAEARALEINLSQAAETGLRQAVAKARAELWKSENAGALESSNAWVEKNGLILSKYRQF